MIEAIVACWLLVIVVARRAQGPRHRQPQLRPREGPRRRRRPDRAGSGAAALVPRGRPRRLRRDAHRRRSTRSPYTIVSRGDWVRDSTGGTASCNNTGAEADYMRITTTTTSGLINSPIPPITMSSLVAPPARRLRRQPGHARRSGQRPRRRGRRRRPGHDLRSRLGHEPHELGRLRDLRLHPDRELHRQRHPGRLGRPWRQYDRHRAGTVTNGTVSVATLELRQRGERRGDLRHRAAQRHADARRRLWNAALGLQRQGARRPVRGPPHLRDGPAAPGSPGSPPPTCSRSPTATASSAAAARRRPDELDHDIPDYYSRLPGRVH